MISTMDLAQMEEVTPWELYPIPTSVQRSITTGSGLTSEEKDRKMVRVVVLSIIFSLGFCSATFGVFRPVRPSGTPSIAFFSRFYALMGPVSIDKRTWS
jgi:hypothetical protein